MIQITPQMRILVAVESVDGRRGIDSLAQLCRETLRSDPFSGCLFFFRNRSAKAIRILAYDGQGFVSFPEAIRTRSLRMAAGSQRNRGADACTVVDATRRH